MLDSSGRSDAVVSRDRILARRVAVALRAIWTLYFAGGVATLIFYVFTSLGQCNSALMCGLAIGKAILWPFFWPFFWMFHTNGFA
jgi:hypothetical protein